VILDLFAGIGGWSLGMEWAGFKTIAACEIDPWKRTVYARHFPGVRLYDDVRQLTGARLAADGIAPRIIVGSPPCKEYSAANHRARGLDGDDLFLEFIRLVGEVRPDWACAENSPRIRTRGFDRIAGELEGLGYAVRAFVLGADDLGAPHIRKRAWIIANARRALRREIPRGAFGDESPHEGRPADTDHRFVGQVAHDSDADRQGEHELAEHGEVGGDMVDVGYASTERREWRLGQPARGTNERPGSSGTASHSCDTDIAGLAQRESERGDARPELAALERTIGPQGLAWFGGPGGHLRLADGLPGAVARRAASAFGDAILPAIAEIIGRAILAVEAQR
jgi:DNA (cytosine-5)-methyltransferase 1